MPGDTPEVQRWLFAPASAADPPPAHFLRRRLLVEGADSDGDLYEGELDRQSREQDLLRRRAEHLSRLREHQRLQAKAAADRTTAANLQFEVELEMEEGNVSRGKYRRLDDWRDAHAVITEDIEIAEAVRKSPGETTQQWNTRVIIEVCAGLKLEGEWKRALQRLKSKPRVCAIAAGTVNEDIADMPELDNDANVTPRQFLCALYYEGRAADTGFQLEAELEMFENSRLSQGDDSWDTYIERAKNYAFFANRADQVTVIKQMLKGCSKVLHDDFPGDEEYENFHSTLKKKVRKQSVITITDFVTAGN